MKPEIGARFGPRAIRAASARQTSFRGFNHRAGLNPYASWPVILDCGDIPVTPFDNALALHQMTSGYLELVSRKAYNYENPPSHKHPKLITLGGDHSIALPALRALNQVYGKPVSVIHFDAHLDTWHPGKYPSTWANSPTQADFTHGSMFWLARQEGLIANSTSVHAGLRTRLSGEDYSDYEDDDQQGFLRIEADDIEILGVEGVVRAIMERMGTENPVYLSVDIDVIDPGLAPGTGTPEVGGWTSREMIQILRGIDGLNLVGADIVEVAPAYDMTGESTALAAAQLVFEMVTSMVKRGLQDRGEYIERVPPRKNWFLSSEKVVGTDDSVSSQKPLKHDEI